MFRFRLTQSVLLLSTSALLFSVTISTVEAKPNISSAVPTLAAKAKAKCSVGPKKNLRGCNYSGKNLTSANLKGANLSTIPSKVVVTKAAVYKKAKRTYAILYLWQDIYVSAADPYSVEQTIAEDAFRKLGCLYYDSRNLQSELIFDSRMFPTDVKVSCELLVSLPKTKTIPASRTNFSNSKMRKANLSSANLKGAILVNADLGSANLSGTQLFGTNLKGVKSGKIIGQPSSLPTQWSLAGGYLVGPGANLQKSVISNVTLISVNLSGTNFKGAVLKNIKSCSLAGKPIGLPTDWKIVGGYLVGPGANLSN